VRSDAHGQFELPMRLDESFVVTATAEGFTASTATPPHPRLGRTDEEGFEIVLATRKQGSLSVAGKVANSEGIGVSAVLVRVARWDDFAGEAYYTETHSDGRFNLDIPMGRNVDVTIDDSKYMGDFWVVDGRPDAARLTAHPRSDVVENTAPETLEALRRMCVPLASNEKAWRQLTREIADVRVVGLGEATHGTREFALWRTEVIQALARSGGLTTIALEAGWAEVLPLNEYVRTGDGDPRSLVAHLGGWPWQTVEILSLVEAVRSQNSHRSPDEYIEFLGIDIDAPHDAAAHSIRDVEELDLRYSGRERLSEVLEPLKSMWDWTRFSELDDSTQQEILLALSEINRLLESQRDELVRRVGLRRWSLARYSALVSKRALEYSARGRSGWKDRDELMATNVLSLLSLSDRERKIALWAHNLHLSRNDSGGRAAMGAQLARSLGSSYYAIGTMLLEGRFLTFSLERGSLVEYVAPVPPDYFHESDIGRVSPDPGCFLSVREAAAGELTDWVRRPRPVRVYGGVEISERFPWSLVRLQETWDGVLFVRDTTPTTRIDDLDE
jgi:erythromycin esterase